MDNRIEIKRSVPDTLVKAVLRHGAETPEQLALALKNSRITYGELRRRILAAAKILRDQYHPHPGDLAAISAVSKPEYVIAMLALQFLGLVTVPIDKAARESAWTETLDILCPRLIITDAGLKNYTGTVISLRGLCASAEEAETGCDEREVAERTPDDPAEIIFTTGTTGKPKGAVLTRRNIEAGTRNTWYGIGMLASDRVLNPLPLHHSFGMRVLRAALWGGASVILQNGFTFVKNLEENIKTYHCTAFVSVPATIETLYQSMGEQAFITALGQLRYIEISAGFLSVKMKKKLLSILPDTELHNTWGSSESGGVIFLNASKYPDKLASIGRVVSGADFRTLDKEGNPTEAHSPDSAGRMALRGSMCMAGYFQNPEETAKTLSNGWLLTNDLVYQDADGFLYMLGRADDIINIGGEKVSPIEIEEAASQFEEIQECACIGVEDPDGVYGMIPVLFVKPEKSEFHEEACAKFLLTRLERWKLPKEYRILPNLPRNRMLKIDRNALRELYQKGGGQYANETIQNILTRRSIRDFTDQPVPRELLETLLECGIHAPSGHNMQTWRFTVIENTRQIHDLKAIVRDAAKRNKVYFYGFNNPSALILLSNDRRNPDGVQDCSCAAQNIMLAAHSLGLGSVWLNPMMTICDEPDVRGLLRSLDVPDQHIVWAMLALGWPVGEGRPLEKTKNVIRWTSDSSLLFKSPPFCDP